MCGIAGFFPPSGRYSSDEASNIAQAMEGAIEHRGPDSGDIWQDESGLVLIHRRLAIIDLSADGAQPMASPSKRYRITFNGEIYNYLDLRHDLERVGVRFKGGSDTEVMLAAFDMWGIEETLSRLNGMFAFALYDAQENYMHFVRDRFGKKPLYVGWVDGSLVFASELKSFHKFPNFARDINKDALAVYMKYGYVHAPYSIFDGVWQVLPSSLLSLDLSNLNDNKNLATKMKTYWSLKGVAEKGLENPIRKSEKILIEEFETKLELAVAKRMISDVPLGAFLSGGIDSSAIVALMQRQSTDQIKTFTAGFEQEGFNEAEHAKAIANHLRTDHQEFYCSDKDALNVVSQLPVMYDEPFADSSQIPTYLISKLAREQATVVLTGDGGDEILGGYDRHTKIPPLWSRCEKVPHVIRAGVCKILNIAPASLYGLMRSNNPHFGAQVKRALSLMGLKDERAVYDALVSGWMNGDKAVLGASLPSLPLHDDKLWPQGLDFANQMIFGDTLSYRPNDLMVKTDRASMAVALEARAPLMDYELAEYSWRLPAPMKIRGGKGKWILREVLKKHVPEELYDRPKMGFSVPLNGWLRGPLKEWAEELLEPHHIASQGLLDNNMVQAQWQAFKASDDRVSAPKDIWTILMFQAWHKEWMG